MHKKEMSTIYLAGLIQGIVLVAFPAASTLLTSPQAFGFTSTQYGALFISQSIFAMAASAFSSRVSQRLGAKATFTVGLTSNLTAMLLFACSASIIHETHWVFPLLILATSFLGVGFGLTVPTINTVAELLRPKKVDTVVLVLNALLGTGTVLAPVFTTIFIAFGIWWGLPLLLVVSLFLILAYSWSLNFPEEENRDVMSVKPLPKRVYAFMAFALFYGMIETLNGNWAAIYMREIQHASIHVQSWALTVFWAMVTIGRVFFACCQCYFSSKYIYQWLPVVAMVAFVSLGLLRPENEYISLFAIGLAGLGCSALLPLTISFGGSQLVSVSRSVAGIVVAFYLVGYGIAAFAPGVILGHTSFTLSNIYVLASLPALALVALAFFINRWSKNPV